ncbi:MAG: hypothetical protein WBE48_18825, partial [Xanthobacteraceae bacterium]
SNTNTDALFQHDRQPKARGNSEALARGVQKTLGTAPAKTTLYRCRRMTARPVRETFLFGTVAHDSTGQALAYFTLRTGQSNG